MIRDRMADTLGDPWVVFGLLGQALFLGRFLVQWIVSERRKEAVIPTAFWYLSICGGLVLLAYAVHLKDPVFICGQSLGTFVYARNITFMNKNRKNQPLRRRS